MTPSQLAEEVERLILSYTDLYANQIESLQGTVYNRLIRTLRELVLDDEGYIKQSAVNRSILLQAENELNDLLPGQSFTSSVSHVLEVIPKIDAINSSYFSSVSDSFSANRNFIKSLQAQTVQSIESTLLQDGLTAQIKNPLSDILNRNINSGGQFKGFLQELREFVEGTDQVEGKILSYSRTYLSDTLFNYARSYQESVTADLNLDWYLYSGGIQDTTRPFCAERAGNYYHRSEIIQWPEMEWAGKRQGTTASSIFVFLGGYNCKHSLIPVHKSIVPEEDQKRIQ